MKSDTLIWLTLLPRCCYVMKHELLRIPLLGPMMGKTRMIAVDRSAGAASMRHLLREADRAVREGRQIVIFPEGTRGAPGRPLPLQPGIAAIAARTGLPVIPVVTDSGRLWGAAPSTNVRASSISRFIRRSRPASRETLLRKLDAIFRSETGPAQRAVDKFVG